MKNEVGKQTDSRKLQNSAKISNDKNSTRSGAQEIETKFDYPDELMKEFLKYNSLDQETEDVISTVEILKEMIETKSEEISQKEKEIKIREENLAQQLSDLSIDQLEQFSEHVLNKRLDRTDNSNKVGDYNFRLDKVHFDYYLEDIEILLNFLKKKNQSEEEIKSDANDLRRSQTNRNLIEDKKNNIDSKNSANSGRMNTYNSMNSRTSDNQVVKTLPNENLKILTKLTAGNTKLNSTTPANITSSPNKMMKQQSTIIASKNSKTSSVVKNSGAIEKKGVSANKSLLNSVEKNKRLERIELDFDNSLLKNDDDRESGFDSDKDNREVYEQKRRERMKSKPNNSGIPFEVLETVESSYGGEGKKKIQRSLSNLGPSARNMKNNSRSDSINSQNFAPANFNNTTKKVNKIESKYFISYLGRDTPSQNKSIVKQSFVEEDLNTSIKMVNKKFKFRTRRRRLKLLR